MVDTPTNGVEALVGARALDAILAGRVTITLGGKRYVIPDLPNGPNRRWLASLDSVWVGLVNALEVVDDGDWFGILAAIAPRSDELLRSIVAYDRGIGLDGSPTRTGVLPPLEEIDETATPKEILLAAIGVWQAANPLAVMAIAGSLESLIPGTSLDPTNSSPNDGGSGSSTSKTSSRRGKRSPSTSIPPRTD